MFDASTAKPLLENKGYLRREQISYIPIETNQLQNIKTIQKEAIKSVDQYSNHNQQPKYTHLECEDRLHQILN